MATRAGLSFANIVVSIPPERAPGTIQWPQQGRADPARDFAVITLTPVPRSGVLDWFKNVTDSKAAAARPDLRPRLQHPLRHCGVPLRPDRPRHPCGHGAGAVLLALAGQVFDYVYDRESTNYSRDDLASVMRTAARSPT